MRASQPLRMSSTARWRSASLCARRSAMWTGYPASISWWRRRLATLSRSLCSCSTISVMSVIPIGSDSSFPRRTLPREVGSEPFPGGLATDGLGRLGAAGDILEPPVEDGSLGLGLRGERPKPIAYLELGLAEPLLERGDELVTLALEGRGHLQQAFLDPLGLLPQLVDGCDLGLAGLVDLLAVGLEPLLRLPDERLLALVELPELRRQGLVRLVEVGAPAREPLLHPLLRRGELRVQLGAGLALPLEDVAPALVGDPPLLLLQAGERVGPFAGEQALDLGGAARGLLADDPGQVVAGAGGRRPPGGGPPPAAWAGGGGAPRG